MKHNKGLLEEILQDEPCSGNCIASMLLKTSLLNDYMIMQLKLIEKFKYVWSESEGRDIGWERATRLYTDNYGAKYKELWDKDEKYHHVMAMYKGLKEV